MADFEDYLDDVQKRLDERVAEHKSSRPKSREEMEKQRDRQMRQAALIDGLSALGNVIVAANGGSSTYDHSKGVTAQLQPKWAQKMKDRAVDEAQWEQRGRYLDIEGQNLSRMRSERAKSRLAEAQLSAREKYYDGLAKKWENDSEDKAALLELKKIDQQLKEAKTNAEIDVLKARRAQIFASIEDGHTRANATAANAQTNRDRLYSTTTTTETETDPITRKEVSKTRVVTKSPQGGQKPQKKKEYWNKGKGSKGKLY